MHINVCILMLIKALCCTKDGGKGMMFFLGSVTSIWESEVAVLVQNASCVLCDRTAVILNKL